MKLTSILDTAEDVIEVLHTEFNIPKDQLIDKPGFTLSTSKKYGLETVETFRSEGSSQTAPDKYYQTNLVGYSMGMRNIRDSESSKDFREALLHHLNYLRK